MLEETTTKNKAKKETTTQKTETKEVKSNEVEAKEVVKEKPVAIVEEKKAIQKRISLRRFIQIKKLSVYVIAVLKATHGTDMMTLSEWEKTLDKEMNKKITE